jgi:ADP-ribosyl-[dinitrogen reductase] hydrolase
VIAARSRASRSLASALFEGALARGLLQIATRLGGQFLMSPRGQFRMSLDKFSPPGSFAPIDDIVGGGPFRLPAGRGRMTRRWRSASPRASSSAAVSTPADQMPRYVRWYREGHMSSTGRCFDIGNTTRSALERIEQTGDPWCGRTDPSSAGNGSIMRLAPVVLAFATSPIEAIAMTARSSRPPTAFATRSTAVATWQRQTPTRTSCFHSRRLRRVAWFFL